MAEVTDDKTASAVYSDHNGSSEDGPRNQGAGYAIIEQEYIIPEVGDGTRKTTTPREYWAFALYNLGATGVGLGNYAGGLQQQLVESAHPSGYLDWPSKTSTSAFILDLNGIIFAVQVVILLVIGPYADYGRWRPWILIVWTIIAIAASFAFLGFSKPSQWNLVSGFYVLGNVAVNVTGSFYFAAYPSIVRDLPQMQESERQVLEGTKTPAEHNQLDGLERSRLSNWTYVFSGLGSTAFILLALAISYGIGYQTIPENDRIFGVVTAYFGGIFILTSIPWFLLDQHRPGSRLPDNTSWLTVGPKQIWEAAKNVAHLKQTFLYILAYFCLADASSTSGNIVQILQNNTINFDTVKYSGLYAVVYGTTGIGVLVQICIQKKWKITPKTMFIWNTVPTIAVNIWGIIGIWTNAIGFHHEWEFWLFQAWIGGASAAWQAYSTTLMAEVSPAPKMYIFFALFNTVGKTSSFVGPFISGAIIDDAKGNNNAGFWFPLFLSLLGLGLLLFVNVDKAKQDCAKFLERERDDLYKSYGQRGDIQVEVEERNPSVTVDTKEAEKED
ncbi:autophagy-related protein 22-like protein [Neohortaea acidophila]|uniref:Autophagy-related protein n=1 Tax=Neohortaea acidophila TaxID=245834 RepID=A0A6A6PH64_9PEZI|nr:autophagy-related protein 22-like protein [Neohortaea acidophila]KAF2479339.1 autophagy-related protein 22-like protein [Neohortaea acidophila]